MDLWSFSNAYCLTSRPLSLLFFSNEGNKSPHIHVKASGDEAKFWLDPVQLAANYGFNTREINEIERLVVEHRDDLLEAWHEHLD